MFTDALAKVEDSLGAKWSDLLCLFACFVHDPVAEKPAIEILAKKYKKKDIPRSLDTEIIVQMWDCLNLIQSVYAPAQSWFPETTDLFPKDVNVDFLMKLIDWAMPNYATNYLTSFSSPSEFTKPLVDLPGDYLSSKEQAFVIIAELDDTVYLKLGEEYAHRARQQDPDEAVLKQIEQILEACFLAPRTKQLPRKARRYFEPLFLSGLAPAPSNVFRAFAQKSVPTCPGPFDTVDDIKRALEAMHVSGATTYESLTKLKPNIPVFTFQFLLPMWIGDDGRKAVVGLMNECARTNTIPMWLKDVDALDNGMTRYVNTAIHGYFVSTPIDSPEFDELADIVRDMDHRVPNSSETVLKMIELYFGKREKYNAIVEAAQQKQGPLSIILAYLTRFLQIVSGEEPKADIEELKSECSGSRSGRARLLETLYLLAVSPFIVSDTERNKAFQKLFGKLLGGISWHTDKFPDGISPPVRALLSKPTVNAKDVRVFLSNLMKTEKNKTISITRTISLIAELKERGRSKGKHSQEENLDSAGAIDPLLLTHTGDIPMPEGGVECDYEYGDYSDVEEGSDVACEALFLTHHGDIPAPKDS